MKFLRKRKKEKDSGELSQAMIIISGLAVAGVTVTGAIAGASLTKGEESARCISNFSAFDSGAVDENCAITASDNDGTLPPGGNENVTPGTPIEKDESSPTLEECFEVSNVSGGASITKYLIAEKPDECGKDVIIPDELNDAPVVDIARYAFNPFYYAGSGINEEHKINSVVIPSTVKTIKNGAFTFNNLTSVEIPDSVESTGTGVFSSNKLTYVKIPDSLTSIEGSVFANNNLTSVNIPDSVEYIGTNAFANNQLTYVKIPDSVTSMGGSTFTGNKLTSVDISNSLTSIGATVFHGNQLTSVTVPKSVKSIGALAFDRNPDLEEIKISTGTEIISNAIPSGTKITYY